MLIEHMVFVNSFFFVPFSYQEKVELTIIYICSNKLLTLYIYILSNKYINAALDSLLTYRDIFIYFQ